MAIFLNSILDRRWLWAPLLFIIGDGWTLRHRTDLELLLCLGGTTELLVHSGVGAVEEDVRGGRIGVSLETAFDVNRNVEVTAELALEGIDTKIPERELELAGKPIKIDLDGDRKVW